MSEHETRAAIPAYIAGFSEFVRMHYERRIEAIEQELEAVRHHSAQLEDLIRSNPRSKLSAAQRFYCMAIVEIVAALEGALPYTKTAKCLSERAMEIAAHLLDDLFTAPAPATPPEDLPK